MDMGRPSVHVSRVESTRDVRQFIGDERIYDTWMHVRTRYEVSLNSTLALYRYTWIALFVSVGATLFFSQDLLGSIEQRLKGELIGALLAAAALLWIYARLLVASRLRRMELQYQKEIAELTSDNRVKTRKTIIETLG